VNRNPIIFSTYNPKYDSIFLDITIFLCYNISKINRNLEVDIFIMKKIKKACFIVFILSILTFIGFRVNLYLNACIKLRDTAAYYAERLFFTPEKANTIIPYEMLSDEYKRAFSSEDYSKAVESNELLELYSNDIFQQHHKRKVDISLSTEGYKKQPAGRFNVDNKCYFISHEIDVAPNWITLEPEIVRWNIDISEIEDEECNNTLN
ncbi:MAG: hypothetical protein K2H82_09980, partial [Oscillospiraceae bacterium]|nr:hypothetical protein [Oscillospiraceae bacterium]